MRVLAGLLLGGVDRAVHLAAGQAGGHRGGRELVQPLGLVVVQDPVGSPEQVGVAVVAFAVLAHGVDEVVQVLRGAVAQLRGWLPRLPLGLGIHELADGGEVDSGRAGGPLHHYVRAAVHRGMWRDDVPASGPEIEVLAGDRGRCRCSRRACRRMACGRSLEGRPPGPRGGPGSRRRTRSRRCRAGRRRLRRARGGRWRCRCCRPGWPPTRPGSAPGRWSRP